MQKCHPGWIHDGLHWKGTHRDPPGTHRPCHLRNWSAWYWGKDLTQQCCAPGIKPGSHIYISWMQTQQCLHSMMEIQVNDSLSMDFT